MATVLGFTAMPAVAANAVVFTETSTVADGQQVTSALADGAQSVVSPAEAVSTIDHDEYSAEAPAPAPAAVAQAAAPVAVGGGIVWPYPFEARINGGFGPRDAPCDGCSTFHDGVDFGGGDGTPIQSIADGVVVVATNDGGGLGTHVEIQHVVGGRTITSSYSHMQYGSLGMSVGDAVVAGQFVGLTGTTGQSTGPHLHFELFYEDGVRIDGYAWLAENAG
ncbi:M23 family metallopeptidase [Microterricola gilva]|nr:M23 family metallopeptidase [Microterricola gilva]